MSRHDTIARWATLSLRPLLLLYPPRFRQTYTAEMLDVFVERYAGVRRQSGWFAAARMWARTVFDLVSGLGVEWVRAMRSPLRQESSAGLHATRKGDSLMRAILQDARLAVRTFAKQPGFALVAVATLALGIGANTAIFSLVNTVLLEPLPYPNSHELVRVWSSNPAQDRERYFTSPLSCYEWQERAETFELNLPPTSYPTWPNVSDTYDGLLERIHALPGVERAGITSSLPLSEPLDYLLRVVVVGEPAPEQGAEPHAWYRQISAELLEATGVPLVRGRAFDSRDREDAPAVVIVNRTLARTLFGEEDPVGRQLSGVAGGFGPLGRIFNHQTEIVGVVNDVRYGSLREPAAPSMYFPSRQAPFRRMTVVVRTSGDPAAIVPQVRREVASTDPNLPLNNVSTLSAVVEHSIARDRFAMMLVSLFGVVAISLAAVGIYGVLSYTVAQRTRELGVRIALGASGPTVLRHVMRQMIVLIGLGVSVGMLGALAATQAISSQLFGVTVRDPVTFGAVALLLGGVACFACYIPTLRATKISPLTALRYE